MKSALPRILPFAVFMAFIGLDELLRLLIKQGWISLDPTDLNYLYPFRAIAVAWLLFRFRKEYPELRFKDLTAFPTTLLVFCAGLLVFVLWIQMDWTLGSSATPAGFNPLYFPEGALRFSMIFFRIAGAVLVVPLMEELFWRSFLIRYIIDNDFEKVRIGTFTWASFLLTIVLFGLEHHYIYAGVMAGIFYNLILYRTRSLAQCVLAHAVTNLALAIYVVFSGKWQFW